MSMPASAPREDQVMNTFDLDGDGTISEAELEESDKGTRMLEKFGEIDSDGDGLLSDTELKSYGQSMRENMGFPMNGLGNSAATAENMVLSLIESLQSGVESSTAATEAQYAYSSTLALLEDAA